MSNDPPVHHFVVKLNRKEGQSLREVIEKIEDRKTRHLALMSCVVDYMKMKHPEEWFVYQQMTAYQKGIVTLFGEILCTVVEPEEPEP